MQEEQDRNGKKLRLPYCSASTDRQTVIQHQVIAELFDGRLHLAPLKHPRRVLDVGAGQGMWALVRLQVSPASEYVAMLTYNRNLACHTQFYADYACIY